MKASFRAQSGLLTTSLIVLASFLASCSSEPTAPEHSAKHAASDGADDDLDSDAGGMANANHGTAEDALDSGMGTQTPPQSKAPTMAAQPAASSNDEAIEDFSSRPRTRYEIISNGFDRARSMPTVNDFDPLDDPSPRISCLSVKAADPSAVSEVVLKQMMVQIAGTADYGPLFPGSLDHVETRLVIGKNNGWVNSQNLTNDMRQVFELAKAPGALVIRITENKFGIYQDIGAPAEVWIRKDLRGHLFFKVYKLDAQRNRTEVFIGYCYQRGGSPAVVRQ